MLFVFLVIIIAASALIGAQFFIIDQYVKRMSYDSKPFIRINPHAHLKFLFIGDSTALGTGAQSNTQSVAGYFGQAYPMAAIDNNSYNGRKIGQLVAEFPKPAGTIYDLIVIQIGGNDIMKFTPIEGIRRDMKRLIPEAKKIGRHVVIMHSGNVGLAPVFIWPFDWIMTHRSAMVRQIYINEAKNQNVLYIDLFTERNNDIFLTDIPKYYCPDHLHPSGEGYKWWYEKICKTLNDANVYFELN